MLSPLRGRSPVRAAIRHRAQPGARAGARPAGHDEDRPPEDDRSRRGSPLAVSAQRTGRPVRGERSASPPTPAYFNRTRVPRTFCRLSVFRKVGTSRSISSKYDESAGVFCEAL